MPHGTKKICIYNPEIFLCFVYPKKSTDFMNKIIGDDNLFLKVCPFCFNYIEINVLSWWLATQEPLKLDLTLRMHIN